MAASAWRAGFDHRDTTPPHVSASTNPTGSALRIVLAATDAAGAAGIECRFGSDPYSARARALVLPPSARVTYRAVDRNGNSSAAYSITAP